jgi:SAM-dependent methyltransferase
MLGLSCPECAGRLTPRDDDQLGCSPCERAFPRLGGVWELAHGFEPGSFPRARIEKLSRFDEGHFWAEWRDALAERLLREATPKGLSGSHVLELGCGTGRFLGRLADQGVEVCGADGHLDLLGLAAERPGAAALVHADLTRLPVLDEEVDLVVALDVLEHVEPGPFLGEVVRVLRPGGSFVLSVPASPLLWSRLDEAAGHRCRYTLGSLRRELEEAGLRLARWTHYQFLLFPLVLASRLLGRRREVAMERSPPRWLDRLLAAINRFEVEVLGGLSLPWGSSLLARAVRVE